MRLGRSTGSRDTLACWSGWRCSRAVERLWWLTRGMENRRLPGELRPWMEEVALVPGMTVCQTDPELNTCLNTRYGPLLNLARLFLDSGVLQLTSGDLSNFAFIFDMNRLFEDFVVGFLVRHRTEILLPGLEDCEIQPQPRDATHDDPVWQVIFRPGWVIIW